MDKVNLSEITKFTMMFLWILVGIHILCDFVSYGYIEFGDVIGIFIILIIGDTCLKLFK